MLEDEARFIENGKETLELSKEIMSFILTKFPADVNCQEFCCVVMPALSYVMVHFIMESVIEEKQEEVLEACHNAAEKVLKKLKSMKS